MAFDVADSDKLLAGARIVVFDDHVDRELGRVPVLIDDGYVFAGSAHGGGDDVGLANSGQREAVKGLGTDVFLLEVGIVCGSARGHRVRWCSGWCLEDGFACDALEWVVEDVETTGGIVDVRREKLRLALEVGGDKLAALVVDAARRGTGDMRCRRARVYGSVGKRFVGEDVDRGAEGRVRNGSDEDAGNDGLDAAIVAGHLVVLREEGTREKKTEDCVAGAEAAHERPPDDEKDSANGAEG